MQSVMGKQYVRFSVVAFLLLGLLGGCSSSDSEQTSSINQEDLDQYFASSAEDLSKDHPIYVNEEDQLVKVYATVNGKYLKKPTRHGMNWVEGSNGHKSVFDTYANPLAFYQALEDIDGNPAVEKGGDPDKKFKKTDEGKVIKGETVDVNITWDESDKVYDINQVMVDSTGKRLAYHFGGNYEAAKENITGCFMCFDSCPVGIVSNASHSVGTFKNGEAKFHGNPDVLPKDGTSVVLTYKFSKSP